MKILYAIQGTGNGHVSRATEIVPLLKQLADVDVLISGIQADLQLPFEVDYRLYGLSFMFGKKGGVDFWQTIKKSRPFRLFSDVRSLPVEKYDLIINDFEPVSAWACQLKRKFCIGLSHQNAVLHPDAPLPDEKDWIGRFILEKYAPVSEKYGFHFRSIGEQIYTPVIRSNIRNASVSNNGHYTVYLPAYSDEVMIDMLSRFESVQWEVFSKHATREYEQNNVSIKKVSVDGFTKSFLSCEGILCTAGFETPAEAIFMGKKLCVIPMKRQYEQACNAAFLKKMGVAVLKQLAGSEEELRSWLDDACCFQIDYPDQSLEILRSVIEKHKNKLTSE